MKDERLLFLLIFVIGLSFGWHMRARLEKDNISLEEEPISLTGIYIMTLPTNPPYIKRTEHPELIKL